MGSIGKFRNKTNMLRRWKTNFSKTSRLNNKLFRKRHHFQSIPPIGMNSICKKRDDLYFISIVSLEFLLNQYETFFLFSIEAFGVFTDSGAFHPIHIKHLPVY